MTESVLQIDDVPMPELHTGFRMTTGNVKVDKIFKPVEASKTRGTTALVYLQLHSSLQYTQALYMYCPVLLEYTRPV